MLMLEKNARVIMTDSGGMQKEAYFFGVPCFTLGPETEWVEKVEAGWNVLTGANRQEILKVVTTFQPPANRPPLYGDGNVAPRIVQTITTTSEP